METTNTGFVSTIITDPSSNLHVYTFDGGNTGEIISGSKPYEVFHGPSCIVSDSRAFIQTLEYNQGVKHTLISLVKDWYSGNWQDFLSSQRTVSDYLASQILSRALDAHVLRSTATLIHDYINPNAHANTGNTLSIHEGGINTTLLREEVISPFNIIPTIAAAVIHIVVRSGSSFEKFQIVSALQSETIPLLGVFGAYTNARGGVLNSVRQIFINADTEGKKNFKRADGESISTVQYNNHAFLVRGWATQVVPYHTTRAGLFVLSQAPTAKELRNMHGIWRGDKNSMESVLMIDNTIPSNDFTMFEKELWLWIVTNAPDYTAKTISQPIICASCYDPKPQKEPESLLNNLKQEIVNRIGNQINRFRRRKKQNS